MSPNGPNWRGLNWKGTIKRSWRAERESKEQHITEITAVCDVSSVCVCVCVCLCVCVSKCVSMCACVRFGLCQQLYCYRVGKT